MDRRAERYRQRPTLLLITGPREVDRKHLAKALEQSLFESGHVVYFIGMANVLYGVDADLGRAREHRLEHLRRFAEVANLLLDAGVLVVASAAELTRDELELIRTAAPPERVVTAWVAGAPGRAELTGISALEAAADLRLAAEEPVEGNVERLRGLLAERGAFDVS